MNRPLDGLKVVELATMVAGPETASLLSDWGADVIKVEGLEGGDPCRAVFSTGAIIMADVNYLWEISNRDKRSIALNLKSPAGLEIMHQLLKTADVFVCAFRENAMQRMGMDYDSLHALYPSLVYVYLNAYGTRGPLANEPGYDWSGFFARSSLMGMLGEPDQPPPVPRPAFGDRLSGLASFAATLLALLARQKDGKGEKIEVSLLGVGTWAQGQDIQSAAALNRDIPRVSRRKVGNPIFNHYQTKDGRWLFLAMAQGTRYWPDFCRAVGLGELAKDERFSTPKGMTENSQWAINEIDRLMATKTLAEWQKILEGRDIPHALLLTPLEIANDEQCLANGYVLKTDAAKLGMNRRISPAPFKLVSRKPKEIVRPPEFGQHTEDILLELDHTWDNISELKSEGTIP